jgi:hypothetical protein
MKKEEFLNKLSAAAIAPLLLIGRRAWRHKVASLRDIHGRDVMMPHSRPNAQ